MQESRLQKEQPAFLTEPNEKRDLHYRQNDQRDGGFSRDRVYSDPADKGMHGFPVRQGFLDAFPAADFPAADNRRDKGTAGLRILQGHDRLLAFFQMETETAVQEFPVAAVGPEEHRFMPVRFQDCHGQTLL